jgi:hypothetical protein
VHTIIELSLALLRLAFIDKNPRMEFPRELDRLVKKWLPGLDILAESLYAKIKLNWYTNHLLLSYLTRCAFP